jgi:diphthamide synthase (EF-2-diphthine--ammonia ligase)
MAKTRISISLEQDQAERIRQHAERAGMDVSAYLVHAATRQMAESDAVEAQFAEVDALIAEAEQAADRLHAESAAESVVESVVELTEQERREVEAAMGLVHGLDRQNHRPGHAA